MEDYERQRKKYGVILLETKESRREPERYIATTRQVFHRDILRHAQEQNRLRGSEHRRLGVDAGGPS